ncbi:hypothetical protein PVNG_05819 [Plasmodium vivax North Korean]|uniref:PIR Superfamily Protein n=1 Tax=Plasmodium vivax North Korean TaxID=1035514 RepID=A0A0J9TZF4_PLAVI|nr:hypothetical protein PVNG_05819 [Plasmodium vivax North Korean]
MNLYGFFEDIKNYIKKADLAENIDILTSTHSECDDFMATSGSYFKDRTTAKRICNEYLNLYDSLNKLKCITNIVSNYKECSKFLNYWINFKLRESMHNGDDSFCTVYNALDSQITFNSLYDISVNFIYDINKDDFYKMNILYRLYKKYTDIDGILENADDMVKRTLLSYSTACCTDYLEAKYICNDGNDDDSNNSQFCTQLKKFEKTYESLYDTEIGRNPEYMNYFKKLSECKNTNVTSTALIGTTVGLIPLMVGLYKVK